MQPKINAHQVPLTEPFFVEYKKTTDHKMDHPHYHDGCEIHFTLCNQTTYYVDDKRFAGNQGTVAVFNSQEIHRVVVPLGIPYERYYCLFKPQFLEFALGEYPDLMLIFNRRPKNFINCMQLTPDEQGTFVRLMSELVSIFNAPKDLMYPIKLRQKLIEVLVFLTEHYLDYQNMTVEHNYFQNELLGRVTQFVRANVAQELSLAGLANQFYTSKSTLTRIFKTHMGMTPFEFITYTRIMKARELILKGYSVHEVAYRVGYRDDSSFIKKFKQLQGVSPKQYYLNSPH